MSSRRSRLDRLLARLLTISQDAVPALLAQQRVCVNGEVATARDLIVDGFSVIHVDGRVLQDQPPVYVLLHKPRGVLSATRDALHPVATALIDHPAAAALHIAGRLDRQASGLLLLTNDGRWSRRLSSPSSGVAKRYHVVLQQPLNDDYVQAFAAGMYFPYEDLVTRPAHLEILGEREAQVTLQEGRYHQIKRMFGRFRNPVLSIHRTAIGGLPLEPDLPPGGWRVLTSAEADQVFLSKA